eukprot:scaffold516735_cov16-Prasinocladus_malaysianus.AAC.1
MPRAIIVSSTGMADTPPCLRGHSANPCKNLVAWHPRRVRDALQALRIRSQMCLNDIDTMQE